MLAEYRRKANKGVNSEIAKAESANRDAPKEKREKRVRDKN